MITALNRTQVVNNYGLSGEKHVWKCFEIGLETPNFANLLGE